ncbi:unnamed protein product, partial [marine sediment metagenome]
MQESSNLHKKKKIRFQNYSTIREVIEKCGSFIVE